MCGKGPAQLLRLSAIIQTLHDAFDFVTTHALAEKKIQESFVKKVEKALETSNNCIISGENMIRAFNLLEFFNKNKMVLSGYTTENWSSALIVILAKILRSTRAIETLEQQIVKFILLNEETSITANKVNQKFSNATAEMVKTIFKTLADSNIGFLKL